MSDGGEVDEQKRRGESVYKYGTVTECPPPPPRKNIHTRLLARFPFLIEIWYWLLTYWVWKPDGASLMLQLTNRVDGS